MDWKIEVVTVPVSDVERAMEFYVEKVGFAVDIDFKVSDELRLVQLTPPGSACSIHLGTSTVEMVPGSLDGVFLVVHDVRAAHAELAGRGGRRDKGLRCRFVPHGSGGGEPRQRRVRLL